MSISVPANPVLDRHHETLEADARLESLREVWFWPLPRETRASASEWTVPEGRLAPAAHASAAR